MKLQTIKEVIVTSLVCLEGNTGAANELNIGVRTCSGIQPSRKVDENIRNRTLTDLRSVEAYISSLAYRMEIRLSPESGEETVDAKTPLYVGEEVVIIDKNHYLQGEILSIIYTYENGDIKVSNKQRTKQVIVSRDQILPLKEINNGTQEETSQEEKTCKESSCSSEGCCKEEGS